MKPPSCVHLGIDGGATASFGVAVGDDGSVLASATAGSLNFFGSGLTEARNTLGQLLAALRERLPSGAEFQHAVIGCAALFSEATPEERQSLCQDLPLPESTRVLSDVETAHFGATLGRPGVVVIAGTGSMVLARGDTGRRAQVGGWGHLLGDEGSAYWIARESIHAAVAAAENRGPSTLLGEAICRFFSVPTLAGIVPILYDSGATKDSFAALAGFLAEDRCATDPVFQEILQRAGAELAKLTAAAIRSAGFDTPPVPVFLIGSVLTKNARVRERFEARLGEVVPIRIATPPLPPTLGAAALALHDAGIPLTPHVIVNLRLTSLPSPQRPP